MPPMNASMFPTPGALNPTPAHAHGQSPGQQPAMGQMSQAQWVQNMTTQRPQVSEGQVRQMLPTGNVAMPGTPLLEWNGSEWIPPQQSSIAAVAASHQVSLGMPTTYQLPPGWNSQQPQQHIDNQSHSNQQSNHAQHSQQGRGSSNANSFNSPEGGRPANTPAKQVRKRQPKANKQKQLPNSQLQNQQHRLQVQIPQPQDLQSAQNLSLGGRSSSPEDLLSADQLARAAGMGSKEDVAVSPQESMLTQSQMDMLQGQQQLQHMVRQQQQQVVQPVLAELTTVVRPKPVEPVEPPKPVIPPRPVRPFDGRFAVCLNCGTMSKNYNNCDYCKRELPDDCKMYDPAKAKVEQEQRKMEQQKKAENERLLLAKLKEEQLKRVLEARKAMSAKIKVDKMPTSPEQKSSRGRPLKAKQSTTSPTATTKSSYGRKVAVKDYSDEDPVWTPSRAKSHGGGKVNTGTKRGRKPKEAEVYVISSSEDDSDEFIPPPTSRGTTSRKAPPTASSDHAPKARTRNNSASNTLRPDLTKIPELYMKCKKITMGSLQGSPKDPLHIAISGVDINLETESESVKVRLDNRDVRECLGCTHQNLPILFFCANESFGVKVRNALKMIDPEQDPYYDPDSTNDKHKYIVGYLDDKAQISNLGWRLQAVFRAISLQYQRGGVLFRFIELHKAQKLLDRINGIQERSSSSALEEVRLALSYEDEDVEYRPPLMFEGPIVKMFQYPFPPAIGAITVTNEDYFCLHDGEFLNDIVLSFYLKYLTEQVFSEPDRERTFIFSSFFYTRLTQPFTGQAAKDTKKTAAEKRHARVKTWTKNVDLFAKDYIIIPINEHSHWYLAIICFPYLDGVVYGEPSSPPAVTGSVDSDTKAEPVGGDNVVSSTTLEENTTLEEKPNQAESLTGSPVSAAVSQIDGPTLESVTVKTAPSLGESSTAGQDTEKVATTDEEQTKQPRNSVVDSECVDLFGFDDSEDEDVVMKTERTPTNKTITKRPCILIFDSLAGPGHGPVIRALREYLTEEWKVKKGTERSFGKEIVRGSNVRCPQQNNYSDCGIYLLQYVETFFKKPITDWSIPLKCTKDMFDYSTIKHKRADIQELMKKYETEFAARPVVARGRPRSTRKSVAAAIEAQKPKAASLSTSVPEALGLSLTGKAQVSAVPAASSSPSTAASSTSQTQGGANISTAGKLSDSGDAEGISAAKRSKLTGDSSTHSQEDSTGRQSTSTADERVVTSLPAVPSHLSPVLFSEDNDTGDDTTPSGGEGFLSSRIGGSHTAAATAVPQTNHVVDHMEVKDESSSMELLTISQKAATDSSSADEAMDHISSTKESLEKRNALEIEEMQTEFPVKTLINNENGENAMQTDPA